MVSAMEPLCRAGVKSVVSMTVTRRRWGVARSAGGTPTRKCTSNSRRVIRSISDGRRQPWSDSLKQAARWLIQGQFPRLLQGEPAKGRGFLVELHIPPFPDLTCIIEEDEMGRPIKL